jgi:hypothetical protein
MLLAIGHAMMLFSGNRPRMYLHAQAHGVDEAQAVDALFVQAVEAAGHEAAVTAAAAAAAEKGSIAAHTAGDAWALVSGRVKKPP